VVGKQVCIVVTATKQHLISSEDFIVTGNYNFLASIILIL